jgi:sarcosine oxidase subunit alpha
MFDGSTLGKIEVVGPDAAEFLEPDVCERPAQQLPVGRCRYGILLREDGFVLDDGMSLAGWPPRSLPRHHDDRRRGARAGA